jgi:hypothetical protein
MRYRSVFIIRRAEQTLRKASLVPVQPQEAVQQVRPPDSPDQEEPQDDRSQDRGRDEPGFRQDAEVVPERIYPQTMRSTTKSTAARIAGRLSGLTSWRQPRKKRLDVQGSFTAEG